MNYDAGPRREEGRRAFLDRWTQPHYCRCLTRRRSDQVAPDAWATAYGGFGTFPTPKATMKRLAVPALLATSALLLSGCLDVDADLTVNQDATATGDMTIAISSEISGLLGLGSGVDLVDQVKQGMLDGAEGVQDLDCSPTDRDDAVAMTCTFENQVFDQADDIWNIYASDDNTVTFYSSSGEEATEEDNALFGDLDFDFGGYTIDVQMPGPIVSVDGTNVEQTSDNSFRIDAGLNDTFEAVVVSEDGSSSFPTFLVILAIIAILAVIAILAYALGRRRKTANDATNTIATADTNNDDAPPAIDAPKQ